MQVIKISMLRFVISTKLVPIYDFLTFDVVQFSKALCIYYSKENAIESKNVNLVK